MKKSIDSTDARAKAYHDKSIDPKLSAETQLRYRTLENRLTTVKDKLYKGMMALDIRRIDLEKRLLTAVENMEFFADSIASGDTEYFLEDLTRRNLDAMKSLNAASQKLTDFLNGEGF